MAKSLQAHEVGLAVGGLFGGLHLVWSVLVALGVAQQLVDSVYRMHMLQPVFTVLPFSLASAVELVIMTAIVGYVVGYALAFIWNKVQK